MYLPVSFSCKTSYMRCLLFHPHHPYRYIAAILQGHVVPAIPYISDAATYSPESCVFGQFINIGCVLREC